MSDSTRIDMNETQSLITMQLLNAIEFNDLNLFEKILKQLLHLENDNTKSCLNTILDKCCRFPGKPDFVEVLFSAVKDADVNYAYSNQNIALIHLVAINGCENVLSVLLRHPQIDINKLDDDGNSALHLAVIHEQLKCVELLLESKDIQPNLMNKNGMTAAYMAATLNNANDKMVRLFVRCPNVNFDTVINGESLTEVVAKKYPQFIPFKYLYSNDEEGFIAYLNATKQLDGNDGEHTYLQYACDYGLLNVVSALLCYDTDPNKVLKMNPKPPIFMASFRGFFSIIKEFLKIDTRVNYQSSIGNVLHYVILGSNEKHNKSNVNNILCDHDKTFKILLKKGLKKNLFDINSVDDRGNTCLHYAAKIGNSNYIHDLLDNGAYISKKNHFGLTPLNDISHDILENYLDKCVRPYEFTTPNEERHKIICSYKFMCPPKVFEYKNNILLEDTVVENIPETEPLLYMNDIPELRPLLMHPVLSGFLYLKWIKIKKFYLVNLIFHFGFLLLLNFYIMMSFCDLGFEINELNFYLRIIVGTFLILSIICKLFQFILSPINFLSNVENWLKLCSTILTLCLIFENNLKYNIPLSLIVIQLSFGEFIICTLSKHPRCALQFEMFKVVTKNFLFYILFYSFIIIVFVLCFHVLELFNDIYENKKNSVYNRLFLTSFQTIAMLTGELNESNLEKNYWNIEMFITILFIFFIPLVLVNLLAGLAVSDTQEIKNDAELVVQKCRIKFIYSIETIITKTKCMAENTSRLKNFFFRIISYCIRWFGFELMLFPDALEKPRIFIFPNRNNVIEFELLEDVSQNSCIKIRQRYRFDDDSVNKAKLIIVKSNSEKRENDTTESVMKILFNKCTDIENTVKEVTKQFNVINSQRE